MIEFKKITKEYGSLKALDDVSFTLNKGEFAFLVGPSGAGKSTLIKLLIRQELPSQGEILYEDIPVTQLKDRYLPLLRQEIGVVFQDFKLINTKTVLENVSFGLEVLRFEQEELLKRVQDALELVDLWDLRDHFPMQLSGGERQRTAIARSIAMEPKVFIADEPTGNIDPTLTDDLFKIFEKINKKGITVMVATHEKNEVNKMKKRVLELDKGRLVRDEKRGKYKK